MTPTLLKLWSHLAKFSIADLVMSNMLPGESSMESLQPSTYPLLAAEPKPAVNDLPETVPNSPLLTFSRLFAEP